MTFLRFVGDFWLGLGEALAFAFKARLYRKASRYADQGGRTMGVPGPGAGPRVVQGRDTVEGHSISDLMAQEADAGLMPVEPEPEPELKPTPKTPRSSFVSDPLHGADDVHLQGDEPDKEES